MPYAYTEQGVAMLSAVLRSDTAVQVSIQTLRVRIPLLAHKKAPRADESPGRSVTLAGLRRLTANTSMYALPCGFAVVGESPRLTR